MHGRYMKTDSTTSNMLFHMYNKNCRLQMLEKTAYTSFRHNHTVDIYD